MIFTFAHLDPINGEHPNTLSMYGVHILKRSRKLLNNRSKHELDEILAFINWIISRDEIRSYGLDRIFEEAEAEEEGKQPPEYVGDYSSFTFLVNLYKNLHKNTSDTVERLEWHEVFATLAISLLNEALDDEIHYGQWKDKNSWLHEWRILDHASTWIVEAMEAINIAEGLWNIKNQEAKSEEALSARNTKAAIQKHKKTNDAILEIEKIYVSSNHRSMRNTVQIYCENNPDKVSHLAPYNRIRTLTEGLSNHLKGKRRSII